MDGIRSWIEAEGSGHWFFVAFPVCLLILFIWFKGRRVRFLIPSLIMSIVIINPWFYQKWDELGLYAYWRILWIIPVIPVVAGLVPSISEKFEKTWVKSIVAAVGVVIVAVGGTFIYNVAGGSFVEAANASKEPDYVVQIADRLLKLDEHPRVIAQDPIGVYLRQYTGEIDTLYGRDIQGYILPTEDNVRQVDNAVSNGDWEFVNQYMLDDEYDYLVTSGDADKSSLVRVDKIADYGIYKASGKPQVIKVRNSLGQVIAETSVNTEGKPSEINGYTTKEYEYDNDGKVIEVIQRNVDDAEHFVSAYGNNYMECGVRAAYKNMRLIYEAYYDDEDNLETQPAGYVAIEQEWDDQGNLLSRTYLDAYGQPLNRIDGYAKAVWAPNEDEVWSVSFYDTDGNSVSSKGLNLVRDEKIRNGEWTEWMTPDPKEPYSLFTIDYIILDKKEVGDYYTCQLEIEFSGVTAKQEEEFGIWTQGTTDGDWKISNIWWLGVWLQEPPTDGIHTYEFTKRINESMVDGSRIAIGFRCDQWASGSFRVRGLKIEKGEATSCWTPGI